MQSAVALRLTSTVDITLQHTPVIAGRFDLQQKRGQVQFNLKFYPAILD